MNYISMFIVASSLTTLTLQANDKINTQLKIENSEKAQCFGSLVEHYEKGRKGYSEEVFAAASKYVEQEESVLDIGCGTGISTLPLINRFANVRGCDWDERMLQKAELKAPGHFDQASVYNLPYKQGQFGLVTCFASFQFFCDDTAMKEISRVLKPSGYMMVIGKMGNTDNSKNDFGDTTKIIMETLSDIEITFPMENYHPQEVLKRNGFEIVEYKELLVPKTYTIEEAIEFVKSRSFWLYVIQEKKEEVVVQKLKTYFESIMDKEGVIHQNRTQNYIIARKLV